MFACCNMTYAKYINKDGTLDKEVYEEEVRRRKEQFHSLFYKPEKVCMCICHMKGSAVLH